MTLRKEPTNSNEAARLMQLQDEVLCELVTAIAHEHAQQSGKDISQVWREIWKLAMDAEGGW